MIGRAHKPGWHERKRALALRAQQAARFGDETGCVEKIEEKTHEGDARSQSEEEDFQVPEDFFAVEVQGRAHRFDDDGRLREYRTKTRVVPEGLRESLKCVGRKSDAHVSTKKSGRTSFIRPSFASDTVKSFDIVKDKLFSEACNGVTNLMYSKDIRGL